MCNPARLNRKERKYNYNDRGVFPRSKKLASGERSRERRANPGANVDVRRFDCVSNVTPALRSARGELPSSNRITEYKRGEDQRRQKPHHLHVNDARKQHQMQCGKTIGRDARSVVEHHYHDHAFQSYAFLDPCPDGQSSPIIVSVERNECNSFYQDSVSSKITGNDSQNPVVSLKVADDMLQNPIRANFLSSFSSSFTPSRTPSPLLFVHSKSRAIFPVKLYNMLHDAEIEDKLKDIVSWQPHGRSFLIHKPTEFVTDVLPRYFSGQRVLTSFQRQLNLYGFKRISQGRDRGAYYHELFLRGRPFLSRHILRTQINGNRVKPTPNPSMEPDFYKMRPSDEKVSTAEKVHEVASVAPHVCCRTTTLLELTALASCTSSIEAKKRNTAVPKQLNLPSIKRKSSSSARLPTRSTSKGLQLKTEIAPPRSASDGSKNQHYVEWQTTLYARRGIQVRNTSAFQFSWGSIPDQQQPDLNSCSTLTSPSIGPTGPTSYASGRDSESCIQRPMSAMQPLSLDSSVPASSTKSSKTTSHHRFTFPMGIYHIHSKGVDQVETGKESHLEVEDQEDPLLDTSIDDVDPEMLDEYESYILSG